MLQLSPNVSKEILWQNSQEFGRGRPEGWIQKQDLDPSFWIWTETTKFYMFKIMYITEVNWSYAEPVWQSDVNTRVLRMTRNNTGVLLGLRRETSLPLSSFDHVHLWTLGFPRTQYSQWNSGVRITNRTRIPLKPCKAKLQSPVELQHSE